MLDIKLDFHSGVPVYRQIVDAIVAAIRCGALAAGEKLPSIRELATELDINPNTTAKVYRELELTGLIESRAGSGSFVLPQKAKSLSAREKDTLLRTLLGKLLLEAGRYRIPEQEVLAYIRRGVR